MSIAQNRNKIIENIAYYAERAGRLPQSIKLIAVSKQRSFTEVEQAIQAGQVLFAENRINEAISKYASIIKTPNLYLHFIGSIQRNKIKSILPLVHRIDSVDKAKVLIEINKQAQVLQKTIDILFEIHTGEETKAGFCSEEELFNTIDLLATMPLVHCKGLMTMAPFCKDEKRIAKSFKYTRKLAESCAKRYPQLDFSTLSMGMSQDYPIAIQEGATEIRIGTAFFGDNP